MDKELAKPKAIGARIKQLRMAMGITTASKFAAHIGVSPQKLWNWENGDSRPDVSAALQLSWRTGVTLDWIYQGNTAGLPVQVFNLLFPAQQQEPSAS